MQALGAPKPFLQGASTDVLRHGLPRAAVGAQLVPRSPQRWRAQRRSAPRTR